MIFYKTKRAKKLKPLNCNTEDEAIEALKVLGVKLDGVEFFTEKQAKRKQEKKKKKTPEELFDSLPDKSQNVWTYCLGKEPDRITERKIKEFGLDKDTDKLYYIYSYWGNGSCGGFADVKEITETVEEKLARSYDESFDFTIYNSKTSEIIKYDLHVKVILKG